MCQNSLVGQRLFLQGEKVMCFACVFALEIECKDACGVANDTLYP